MRGKIFRQNCTPYRAAEFWANGSRRKRSIYVHAFFTVLFGEKVRDLIVRVKWNRPTAEVLRQNRSELTKLEFRCVAKMS